MRPKYFVSFILTMGRIYQYFNNHSDGDCLMVYYFSIYIQVLKINDKLINKIGLLRT